MQLDENELSLSIFRGTVGYVERYVHFSEAHNYAVG